MRILVCGGREYADRARVWGVLDAFHGEEGKVSHIIQGGADGADALAREWALARCVPVTTYPANWSKFGKAAGPMRNADMARAEYSMALDLGKRVLVLAFPGGRGTRSMVRIARELGLVTQEVE